MTQEQCSSRSAWHISNSYPTRSLREYLAYKSVQNSQQTEMQFNQIEIQPKDSKKLSFQIQVDIGDGRSQVIIVDAETDINKQAENFCKKYHLDANLEQLLANTIRQKYQNQKEETLNESIARQHESITQVYSNNRVRQILVTNSDSETQGSHCQREAEFKKLEVNSYQDRGANKILKNYYSKSKKYSLADNYLMQNKENQPGINKLSLEICQKIGKQNIIEQNKRKSRDKYYNLLKEKRQRQEQLIRQCAFKPKINAISKQVDKEIGQNHVREEKRLERFEKLYENHKQIQLKKEQERQNYLMDIPFKPNINYISRKIMENKKSINIEIQEGIQKKSHIIPHQSNNSLPHTGRGPKNRNLQNLPIGDYLYNQAMKKSIPKYIEHKIQIKALDHSDYLISILKEKKINQMFTNLTRSPHQELFCEDINLSSQTFKFGKYKYFAPIFNEMIEMDISITRQQFLQASLNLFKTFSPDQKYDIIFKKQKQNSSQQLQRILMNSKSRQFFKQSGYERIDIYNRGIQHRKHVQEKNQKNRQNKARSELRQCTFKPIIKPLN